MHGLSIRNIDGNGNGVTIDPSMSMVESVQTDSTPLKPRTRQ